MVKSRLAGGALADTVRLALKVCSPGAIVITVFLKVTYRD